MLSRLRAVVSDPEMIVSYTKRRGGIVRALLARGRYALAACYLADTVSDGDWVRSYLASNEHERFLDCEVLDFRMWVNLLDEGMSRDLLADGYREKLATAVYRAALARTEAERGGLTVVDIGANIGYFALLYPAQSRRGTVIAIEPHPESAALLRENVTRNGLEKLVDCYQCAIGATSGTATLRVSRHRNLCATTDDPKSHYVDEMTVPMRTLDDFLTEHGHAGADVDVLRMDVQGYEYEVFQGMTELLDGGNVRLAFLELHPWYLRNRGEYDEFLTMLQEVGFELIFAADGRTAFLTPETPTYVDRPLDVETLDELRDVRHTVEVVLWR